MRRHFYFPALFLITLLFGCNSEPDNPKFISEGIIEFKATPVDPENSKASLAPSKMVVKFKDNYSAAEMSAGYGFFSASFISDPEKMEFINMVRFLTDKSVAVLDSNDVKKDLQKYPKPVIKFTEDTKVIAGYLCKKADVSFSDPAKKPFSIYYTTELNMQNPNWSNMYREVPGVLMEYQLFKFGLELRFSAVSVTKANIDESVFQVPKGYKPIPLAEMEEMFNQF